MTLQTLEYFIAVAQYRNFTRAAEACHVTQPALSRAIRALEEELGCPLMVRAGRMVTLTPEGEVCLAEAKGMLRQSEELRQRVQEAELRSPQPLRVGYIMIDYLNDFMQSLFGGADSVPSLRIETVYDTAVNVKRDLMDGKLDAVLLPEVCIPGLEDVEYSYYLRGPLHAIIHKTNPLSRRESIYLRELRDKPIVMWTETLIRTRIIQLCAEAGFVPRIVAEGDKLGDILAQATIHNGIGVGSALFGKKNMDDYRGIPILDSPEQFGSVCVWRKGNRSPMLKELKGLLGLVEER